MDVSGIGLNTLLNMYGANSSRPPGNLDEATQRLIENKDKDGNGTLNAVEIAISEEAFQLADANADGELDANELKNSVDTIGKELAAQGPKGMQGPPPTPRDLEQATERLVQDLDEDGDGALSTDELPISPEVFNSADTNQDGVLNLEELRAAFKEIGEELRAEDTMPRQHPLLGFSRSGSEDTTETTLNQIA